MDRGASSGFDASPQRGAPVLEVKNLVARYGQITALRGISLRVTEGQVVALIGANGAGKSTTLRVISGLLRPAGGEVLVQGRPIRGATPRAIVNMGVVHCPEGRRIFTRLTVLENLRLGHYTRGHLHFDEAVGRVYALFPILKERQAQLAGTLSGGEQQMLAMGRALMLRPKLLLLDEPSLGLAPLLVQEIFRSLVAIHREGVGILLVEQNAFAALSIAHRGHVLET
ncbi:MAG TPA: ABC transporter ATP-binding protein, partial [Candidatus Methylomirabilis sp.]|nr:ABC transporter ATP-binding protein [Candidatus Methylomirabilis sp.]